MVVLDGTTTWSVARGIQRDHRPSSGRDRTTASARSHDASSRARVWASPTRRSMFSAQGADTAPESLPSRLRIAPSFRSILRNAAARAAGSGRLIRLDQQCLGARDAVRDQRSWSSRRSPRVRTRRRRELPEPAGDPLGAGERAWRRSRAPGRRRRPCRRRRRRTRRRWRTAAPRGDVVVELVDVVWSTWWSSVDARPRPARRAGRSRSHRRSPRPRCRRHLRAARPARPRASATGPSGGAAPRRRPCAARPPTCRRRRRTAGRPGSRPHSRSTTPSKPARSGLARSSRAGKSTRAGPRELNGSTSSSPGSAASMAATATTSSSAGWPTMLPAAVTCSSAPAPRQKSSSRRGSPAKRSMTTLASCVGVALVHHLDDLDRVLRTVLGVVARPR